ncbi:hypothetical protein [Caenispirillum bisanense]|uniref:hypothetical protein n=1 Tax=Caenispirillum bisanense TaxID=414052 RepID=UPI0031DFC188
MDDSLEQAPQARWAAELPPAVAAAEEAALLARLPADFVQTLTADQRRMLRRALPGQPWKRHPVDLRFTLPLFGRGVYLAVVAGAERRGAERRRDDRLRHPLHTLGNLAFLAAVAALLYALVLTGMFLARDLPLG